MKLRQLVIAALAVSSTAVLANTADKSTTASASSQGQVASTNGSMSVNGSANSSATFSLADSSSVSQIQQALNDKGFNVGPVDGVAGPRTKAAIKRFRQSQGLDQSVQLDQPLLLALGIQENGSMSSQNGAATTPQNGSAPAPPSSQTNGNSVQPSSSSSSTPSSGYSTK